MQKQASLLFGLTLILLGVLALAGNLLMDSVFHADFRAWPIFVVGVGLLFCIPPFIFTQVRGLGGLFIPGMPVLATGILLFITSMADDWSLWGILWPFEVISLALGFLLAAIFLRVVWLTIPASIIGFTGLALLFCAITGRWDSWAVLWTVVPFSVGLPLLLIGIAKKLDGVKLAGLILTGVAGALFAALSTFLVTSWWVTRLVGPAIVIGLGGLMIISALTKRSNEQAENQTENQSA